MPEPRQDLLKSKEEELARKISERMYVVGISFEQEAIAKMLARIPTTDT